jgi:uncharacterized protein (TIGR03437 family)
MRNSLKLTLLILAAGALLPAAPISGTLDMTGSVAIGFTTIDWFPAGGGTGTFLVEPSSTGSFAPLAATAGSAADLNLLVQAVNTPIVLTNFLTFAAAPTIRLDLNFIFLGVSSSAACLVAPAIGQECSPSIASLVSAANPLGVSPLNFANIGGLSSSASFSVQGTAVNTATAETSPFSGVVTLQFAGQSYQQVLAVVAGSGTATASFSATLVVGSGQPPPPTSCSAHTVHGHISTVPPGHFAGVAVSHEHHGQHGHTVAVGANCPPHAPGHSPGLQADPADGLFSANAAPAAPESEFMVARNQAGDIAPTLRGTVVQLFGSAAGLFLGERDDQPAYHLMPPASGSPLYYTTSLPQVRIAGVPAEVLFSGLAPGLNGVWQINVLVPEESPAGKVPVAVSYEGQEVRSVDIEVR